MTESSQLLGQRIVQAARLAAVLHSSQDFLDRERQRRLEAGGAGIKALDFLCASFFRDEAAPRIPDDRPERLSPAEGGAE